jgi:23S rRNA pseudouridine2457 synthase
VLLAFNKPYGVLSQFTADGSDNATLSEFKFPPNVYSLGRLDADSEGLLLLTDERALNQRILNPRSRHPREYWAQVERAPSPEALEMLRAGVMLEGRKTLPARAEILDPQPIIGERFPPIRFRKTVPTCWLSLELIEGKNRQVRRMTAAVGHATVRLIRVRIGRFALDGIATGEWVELNKEQRRLVLG